MDLQTFISNFRHVADAPNGVKSIRQLIMASALAGRFSTPNKELTKNIQLRIEEIRSLHFVSTGKREKPLVFGNPLIHEFEIPAGWQWVRVGQICDLQTGATPSTQKPEYWGGDIPWLASGDVNRQEIFDCQGRITEAGLLNSNCKVLPKDSVLIALNGQGKTRATVALLRVPAACNQSLVAMTPFDTEIITSEYLFLSLRYRYYEIRDITGQDQRRGLNMSLVSELSVPLPPLVEQNQIVAKVSQLMALCDQLELQQQERESHFQLLSRIYHARLTEIPNVANVNRIFDEIGLVSPSSIRETVVSLASEGRLVNRHSSKASPQHSKRTALTGASYNDSVSLTALQIPSVPRSWSVQPLAAIADAIVDCPHSTPKWISSGRMCVRTTQFKPGYLDLSDVQFVSEETYQDRIKRLKPQENDILYSREGGILGVACRVPPGVELCLGQRMVLIRAGASIIPKFLEMILNSPYIREIARDQTTGGAAPRVNVSTIRSYPIPVPPLEEQRLIIGKVDELMALIDQLEVRQQERNKLADAFAKACIASFVHTSQLRRPEKMKAPKNELVSVVTLGKNYKTDARATLAELLAQNKGTLSAKLLWQKSGLSIDAFYHKLKEEITMGWIMPPIEAEMKEVEAS